jgi:RTA1 like protein
LYTSGNACKVKFSYHSSAADPSSHFTAWKATGLLPLSTLIFVAGYITRELGAFDYTNIVKYIVSMCLVYGAPPMYELANYIILGRILYYVPYHSPIHPGRVITTFGFISMVVEALNANGAAFISNVTLPEWKQQIGHNLLKAGLAIQLGVIVSFLSLAIYFQRKCTRNGIMPKHLKSVLTTLYISSTLIAIRTIYRTVEYFAAATIHVTPGFDPMSINRIIRYEWFFWVFEATLMVANSLLLNFRHPAMYLPRSNKIYLAEDGVTEIKGPGFEDKRNFLLTIFDPFDVVGLVIGRDKKERYWEGHERIVPMEKGERSESIGTMEEAKHGLVSRTPWGYFKLAFLTDRGNQGKELKGAKAVGDVEMSAGATGFVEPTGAPRMVGPTGTS